MPGFSNETFTFDGNGNVTARKNRNGNTINQVYDVVNRLTTIDYPTGTDTTFTYDAASRKTGMTDSTGTWTYGYNARNEVTSVASPTGKTVSYTYDNVEGRRLSMALSTYGTWSYLYDNGGRLTSVTNPNTETTSYTYNKNNQITQVTNGNTTTANYAYNSRLFLTSLTNKYSNQTVLSGYTYQLDNVGNRTRMTEANGDYTDYTYDSAYQLTRDWKRNNLNNSIYDYSYTFDASGNRLTMVDNMTQTTTNYTYDSLNRMTAAGNISYAFDDNGNTTSKTVNAQTTSYTYSYENWLTQITYPNQSTNTFSYDGGGIRFSKTDSGGTTKYVRDGDSLIAELDGSNNLVAAYTNGPNGLVSQRRNNATKFHHFDGLGSTRQLTDSTQTITDTYSFDAYGNITGQGGTSTNPAKYVGSLGYYADGDSGLMLLGHRYYDPAVGRFITLDPIEDGVNWYGYCENNPVGLVDPAGLNTVQPWTKPHKPHPSLCDLFTKPLSEGWPWLDYHIHQLLPDPKDPMVLMMVICDVPAPPSWVKDDCSFVSWIKGCFEKPKKVPTPEEMDCILNTAQKYKVGCEIHPGHPKTPWPEPHLHFGETGKHCNMPKGY